MERGGLCWCESCGLVRYCGEVCKGRGEEEHREECRAIGQKNAGGRVLNDELRLVARIWLKLRKDGKSPGEKQGVLLRNWTDLEDNFEKLLEREEKFLHAQYHLLGAVLNNSDMPDFITFVHIYGKIVFNGFLLRSSTRSIFYNSLEVYKYSKNKIR